MNSRKLNLPNSKRGSTISHSGSERKTIETCCKEVSEIKIRQDKRNLR